MNITLTVGDDSGDGHDKQEHYTFESNLSKEEVVKAFKKGTKIVGFDLTELCADYEDSEFPEEERNKFLEHVKLTEMDMPNGSHFEEGNPIDDCMDTELYAGAYLAIAKLGNPKLETKFIESDSIAIGGYGLFW